MDEKRRKELEAGGFKFTNIGELFDLSEAEVELIEAQVARAIKLRERRGHENLSHPRSQ